MAADYDTIGRNKAGHPKNYEGIVDATACQIADRDVTLIPGVRYDRGQEFGRRGTDGNDRQADEGVRYIPETRQIDSALDEPVGADNDDDETNREHQHLGCRLTVGEAPVPELTGELQLDLKALSPGRADDRQREYHAHGDEHEALQPRRSEEQTSELQSLMRISYAVFCLKKKTKTNKQHT